MIVRLALIAAVVLFGSFGPIATAAGYQPLATVLPEDDPNPLKAFPLATIYRSLRHPVPFEAQTVDGRNFRDGRKPKVIIDPDGRGAVIGAQAGALGFALYRRGRPPAIISRFSNNDGSEDAQAADLTGDGVPDIVVGGLAKVTYLLLNPRRTACSDVYRCRWALRIIDRSHPSHDVVVGDVDHDGSVDIATENGIYFNHRHGRKWTFVGRNLIARDGQGTSLASLAADRILDVIAPYRAGTMLGRFINPLHHHGDPARERWAVQIIDRHPLFNGDMTSAIVDVNGDGRNDIVLAPMYGGGGLVWYEAPTRPNGVWLRHMIDPSINFVHQGSLQVADFAGDGHRDIAFAEQDQSPTKRIGVFYNVRGDGSTWRLQVLSAKGGGHNIKAGIVGSDTRPSIVSARHGYFGGANPLLAWRDVLVQPLSVRRP